MKRRTNFLLLIGLALLGMGLILHRATQRLVAQPVAKNQPESKAGDKEQPLDPARQAVMANVRTFTEAFNRRDVPALLKLFADDCVLTEHDGTTVRGLKELEEELKESFADDPDAKISVSVDSLALVAPDVIIEEGTTAYYPDGKTLTAETEYQATHVKKGDGWLMTRVRSFNRVVLSPYDQLRDLEWLVGSWVDESDESVVESTYRWDVNNTFLLNDFSVKVKGRDVLTGTQRIGRDPLSKQLKAWVFDSEGGYAESLWSSVDDAWIIKAKGVRPDGKVVTVTNQLTQLGKDRYRFDAVDRLVGDERMPDLSVVVVRKPPQAKR